MHQGLEAALSIVQPAPTEHANCHPSRVEENIVLFCPPHFQLLFCYLSSSLMITEVPLSFLQGVTQRSICRGSSFLFGFTEQRLELQIHIKIWPQKYRSGVGSECFRERPLPLPSPRASQNLLKCYYTLWIRANPPWYRRLFSSWIWPECPQLGSKFCCQWALFQSPSVELSTGLREISQYAQEKALPGYCSWISVDNSILQLLAIIIAGPAPASEDTFSAAQAWRRP